MQLATPTVSEAAHQKPAPRRHLPVVAAALACPTAYLIFVTHFWVNEPDADDWNVLWLVSQSVSGHLTLGMLWAQHYEDRMFFPNLIFVASGRLTHGNEKPVMALSAVVFIATYFAFLGLCRSYLGRLTWPLVLTVGVVWFSFVQYGDTLFAILLSWYMVLALFIGMLWLLMGGWKYRQPTAIALAVVASFCVTPGLVLWPVGLLCLLLKRDSVVAWVVAAVATVGLYFIGYSTGSVNAGNLFPANLLGQSAASISVTYPFAHLGSTISLSLAEIGLPFPPFRQLAGAITLVVAAIVLVRAVQRRELLPVALITFACLFDAIILAGRLHFGYLGVTGSRYSMPGLIMLLAIVLYAWKHLKSRQLIIVGFAAIAIQVAVSTAYGLDQSSRLRAQLDVGRQLVTANSPPASERLCYGLAGFYDYLIPVLSPPFVSTLRAQRLSVFVTPPHASPPIPQCKTTKAAGP
jgi:hypothetical protein